jgi:DNA-binding HxlR family transcriptional regulator
MDSILRLLSGPWTTYIVWILSERGIQRFGTLKRQVGGISTRMLTARLRLLEDSGLVLRHVVQTAPPQVSYELTARGRELGAALRQLNSVAERWQAEDRDKAA